MLDIGIYYGEKGVGTIKSLPLYQRVDSIVNFDDKFDLVRRHGENLYTYLDNKFRPIIQQVFFLYDSVTMKVSAFINVITTKQEEVNQYVTKTYSLVNITVEGSWMRLDFDKDGSVSVDDLKKSMVGLYDFLKNFDIIETTTTIKSKLYTDAIKYMQAELEEDTQKKAIDGSDKPVMVEDDVQDLDKQKDIDSIN